MKHLYLALLLLPVGLQAQGISSFLGQPLDKVGKSLERKHLAFDTSFRYSDPPSIDYIAYAPYRIAGIPGVLRLRGSGTVSGVVWDSRGLDVDSDLNFVLQRNPTGKLAVAVRAIGKTDLSQSRFKTLVAEFSKSLGKATSCDSTFATWARGCTSLRLSDGFASFSDHDRLTPRTFQPVVFDSAKSAGIRARLSPGFRGLTRQVVEQRLRNAYDVRQTTADSRAVQYSPYHFHGIPGVLALSFDSTDRCNSIFWSSHDPDWLIAHSHDTTSAMYRSVHSLVNLHVTEEQYNKLREEIGLERLKHPRGQSFLEYWPILQELRYESGILEYTETPGFAPPHKGLYLVGAEPTMDVTTGH